MIALGVLATVAGSALVAYGLMELDDLCCRWLDARRNEDR